MKGIGALERSWGKSFGTNASWQRLLTECGIHCLLTSTYDSPYVLPALQTAANLGLRTVVATNSWKDVYTTTKVAVVPSALLVWSPQAADDLCEMNPHVSRKGVYVAKSLHLEPFSQAPSVQPREQFCRQLGIDSERPLICYTAAAPAAVMDEECIVDRLLTMISEGVIQGRPQVILRMNPMEDGSRWHAVKLSHPELILQKPLWEAWPAADWCCALPHDVPLWVALTYYADVNISIASTVTLEFAAWGKPVVNVCFDLPSPRPAATSNSRFWNAEFYKEVRDQGLALPTFSQEELAATLSPLLAGEAKARRRLTPANETSPVERLLDIVAQVLA